MIYLASLFVALSDALAGTICFRLSRGRRGLYRAGREQVGIFPAGRSSGMQMGLGLHERPLQTYNPMRECV